MLTGVTCRGKTVIEPPVAPAAAPGNGRAARPKKAPARYGDAAESEEEEVPESEGEVMSGQDSGSESER
jgi:hypothetical protein